MRWVALALVILNTLVWQVGGGVPPGLLPSAVVSGNLPRVASLKVQGEVAGLADGERACVRLGWFRSFELASDLKNFLPAARVSGLGVKEIDRSLPPLHWVIVPPQPPGAALEQLRDMQSQGIDSYLVAEGENKNAISLGLFESRDAAKSVVEEKKRNNFNVVLANFDRNQISYALAFETEPDFVKEMVQAVRTGYGSEFDFVEVNRCESVATSGENP